MIVIGKTRTVEFAYGGWGTNQHMGTPWNPWDASIHRTPGGSSSGSGVAVAARMVPCAIGTDTGGSVRVPASFCGLFGIRPTHGRIDFAGITQQAPSSDTVGWFARDGATFARVGEAVFGAAMPDRLPIRLIVAVDAFGFADEAVRTALEPMVTRLGKLIGDCSEETLAPQGLSIWQWAQRVGQSSEAWATFQPWIDQWNPRFAFGVAFPQDAAGRLVADRSQGADAPVAAGRYHPVSAHHAVSGTQAGPVHFGAGTPARSHFLSDQPWRIDGSAAGEPAGCRGGRRAGRPVDRRRTRHRPRSARSRARDGCRLTVSPWRPRPERVS